MDIGVVVFVEVALKVVRVVDVVDNVCTLSSVTDDFFSGLKRGVGWARLNSGAIFVSTQRFKPIGRDEPALVAAKPSQFLHPPLDS